MPEPLVVTPKIKGPGRFEVTGSLDLAPLAAGGASGSSGGALSALIYRISKEKSWVRMLAPRTRG